MNKGSDALQASLVSYQEWLTKKGGAKLTIASYLTDLRDTAAYLTSRGVTNWQQVDRATLTAYLQSLNDKGRRTTTIQRRISSLRRFYAYLQVTGQVNHDPVALLKAKQTPRLAPVGLTPQEADLLPDHVPGKGVARERNRALVALLVATGARANELRDLQTGDLDLELGVVYLGQSSRRLVPLNEQAQTYLTTYLTARADQSATDEGYVFLNNRGQPLSRQSIWEVVNATGQRANIEGAVTPQRVRDGFAYRLLAHGADLSLVQQLMGHQSILTTQVYLEQAKEGHHADRLP